jgi:hypothetical protein
LRSYRSPAKIVVATGSIIQKTGKKGITQMRHLVSLARQNGLLLSVGLSTMAENQTLSEFQR